MLFAIMINFLLSNKQSTNLNLGQAISVLSCQAAKHDLRCCQKSVTGPILNAKLSIKGV